MANQKAGDLLIGRWRVEPLLGRISSDSGESFLRPKEMDLLVYLAQQQGQIVSADDIMSAVWAGVEVTNDSLYFSISQLRKSLDAPDTDESIIETMTKRGYRLTVPVQRLADDDTTDTVRQIDIVNRNVANAPRNRLPNRVVLPGMLAALLVVSVIVWLRDTAPPVIPEAANNPSSSIAVMPLIDLSPDTDYTYFSDGITDEILNRLARVQGLMVAARTSSFAFKNSEASVREIGIALDVGSILEGSVRKDGDLVRVSVQLIDAGSGFQMWSETYEREVGSIFAIQNEVSRQIADALKLTLAGDVYDTEAGDLLLSDPRAVDEYLLGLESLRTTSFGSYRQAVVHFENVLRIDPTFTQALVQLADAKLGLLSTGASDDMRLIDEAEQLARQTLEHDPDSGAAYRVLGMVSRWRGQWQQSEDLILKALELSPSDSVATVALGAIHVVHGDLAAAGLAFERALRIDPYGVQAMMKYAWLKERIGEVDAARATLERAIELHPANPNLPWMLGKIQVGELGDLAGGLENFLRSAALDAEDYEIAAYVAMTYLTLEMPDDARPWVDRALTNEPGAATSYAVNATYLQLAGQKRDATAAATKAIRDSNYRLLFHELLTENLIVIAAHNLLEEGRIDYAIELLEGMLSTMTGVYGPGRNVDIEGTVFSMNKFSDSWLASLAFAYQERGDTEKASELLDNVADYLLTRKAERKGTPHNSLFLAEARMLALQGQSDAALDMLEGAVAHKLIFGWQVHVAGDYVFRDLQSNPRFLSIIDQLEAETGRQRAIVLGETALTAVRLQ